MPHDCWRKTSVPVQRVQENETESLRKPMDGEVETCLYTSVVKATCRLKRSCCGCKKNSIILTVVVVVKNISLAFMPDNYSFQYVHARVDPRSRKHSVNSAFCKLRKKIRRIV